MAEVLDEPYSQLIQLSGVAVQARPQSTLAGTVSILCSMATPLSGLSRVRFVKNSRYRHRQAKRRHTEKILIAVFVNFVTIKIQVPDAQIFPQDR